MSSTLSLVLEEGVALQTAPGMARIVAEGHENIDLDTDDLGMIAEWLAVAWENVAGEEYKPVIISDRGYVAHEGHILIEDAVTIASRLDRKVRLERDCE